MEKQTKSQFEKEVRAKIANYEGSALKNNFIIGYSMAIPATDPTDDPFTLWRTMTIPRAMMGKVGFAASLKQQTMRLKLPSNVNPSSVSGKELVKYIKDSPHMILFNDPNEVIAKDIEETKERERLAKAEAEKLAKEA